MTHNEIDKKLSDILRRYQKNFSDKVYVDDYKSTDVLSFPIGEKGADGNYYLGDIIISVPQANKQCLQKKHGLERELEILTVHGFLHLLGYEHFEGMEEEEDKIKKHLFERNNGN